MKFASLQAAVGVVFVGACAAPSARNWRDELDARLASFGHRNVVAIVDSAYPVQSRESIETLATGGGQIEVLREVLDRVKRAPHVRPKFTLDRELAYVPEADAPGIDGYRAELRELLTGAQVEVLPHGEILASLDRTAQAFDVLVLKTDLALPYTSVFVTLECGYWSDDAESRLRETMAREAREGVLR
jgi:hypothetical protein